MNNFEPALKTEMEKSANKDKMFMYACVENMYIYVENIVRRSWSVELTPQIEWESMTDGIKILVYLLYKVSTIEYVWIDKSGN